MSVLVTLSWTIPHLKQLGSKNYYLSYFIYLFFFFFFFLPKIIGNLRKFEKNPVLCPICEVLD